MFKSPVWGRAASIVPTRNGVTGIILRCILALCRCSIFVYISPKRCQTEMVWICRCLTRRCADGKCTTRETVSGVICRCTLALFRCSISNQRAKLKYNAQVWVCRCFISLVCIWGVYLYNSGHFLSCNLHRYIRTLQGVQTLIKVPKLKYDAEV